MKTKAVNPSELMTPAQIAADKGIARKNVYKAIHDGRMTPVTVAGVIFVTRQSADAWEPSQSHVERAKGRRTPDNIATAPNPSHPSHPSEQSEQSEGAA